VAIKVINNALKKKPKHTKTPCLFNNIQLVFLVINYNLPWQVSDVDKLTSILNFSLGQYVTLVRTNIAFYNVTGNTITALQP